MAKRMKEKSALRQQNKDTRPTATARYVRMSATKAKRVLDIIKGQHIAQANAILDITPSTASMVVKKVLNSAVANAENNKGLNKQDLYVAEIYSNQGATYKRTNIRGRGRVDQILKRTSHIKVILDVAK